MLGELIVALWCIWKAHEGEEEDGRLHGGRDRKWGALGAQVLSLNLTCTPTGIFKRYLNQEIT